MNITERKAGDVTILDVEGKILLGEGDVQLKHKIDELVEKKQTKLVLNLANVPYMDSGGLGEIVRSFTTVKRAGGELKLLNATARISDLLTITKLYTVFDIHDEEPKAVGSFNKSDGCAPLRPGKLSTLKCGTRPARARSAFAVSPHFSPPYFRKISTVFSTGKASTRRPW